MTPVDQSSCPSLQAPTGTCDCHMHVYGPESQYPLSPTCPFPPPLGGVDEYQGLMDRLGIHRVVVVQALAYGTDNRCTMDAVDLLGKCARAVVVVDQSVREQELADLTAKGARGIRFHMLGGGVLPWESISEIAHRVNEHGWHIQLQLDGRSLPEHITVLKSLPCDLVIDHVGKFLEPVPTDHPSFLALLKLVDTGHCWVKLSAPYETSKVGPPHYDDVGALARTLVATAPHRMLWASNWPHPSAQNNLPDDATLLDTLLDWVADPIVRRQILVDNPAHVYDF